MDAGEIVEADSLRGDRLSVRNISKFRQEEQCAEASERPAAIVHLIHITDLIYASAAPSAFTQGAIMHDKRQRTYANSNLHNSL